MSVEPCEARGGASSDYVRVGKETAPPRPEEEDGAAGTAGQAQNAEADLGKSGCAAPLEDQLSQEIALKEKYLAGWQRAQADLENFKKRVAREQADLRDAVVESMVRDMLPALDSLERAVKHAKASASDESIAQGLGLVLEMFLDFLEKAGIKPIPAAGEVYDSMKHEAIMMVPTMQAAEGTVLDELQRGYASARRVVRPALVTVACRPSPEGQEGSDPGHDTCVAPSEEDVCGDSGDAHGTDGRGSGGSGAGEAGGKRA